MCREHNKAAGMHIIRPNRENIQQALAEGYTLIALGVDVVFLAENARLSLQLAGRSLSGV